MSTTGASPEQLARALRSQAYQSYTNPEKADRAIAKGLFSADTINGTLNKWAPHLVRPDERIVLADDLRAALSIIERHTGDEPSPLTDRLRAAIGTPTAVGTEGAGNGL